MIVNILGEQYQIIMDAPESLFPEGTIGRFDGTSKTIYMSQVPDSADDFYDDKEVIVKAAIRHEIIHAFLFESGLSYGTNDVQNWAVNEEMVDWIAKQFPKLLEAFKEADCL